MPCECYNSQNMFKNIKIVGLCLIVSLLGLPTKAIAEPLEIKYQNIKVYAFEKVLEEWGSKEWVYFDKLIEKESNWLPYAKNLQSSAYGLGQLLDSTWGTVGCVKTSNPQEQIDCTIKYVKARYKTPQRAIHFHNLNNWY